MDFKFVWRIYGCTQSYELLAGNVLIIVENRKCIDGLMLLRVIFNFINSQQIIDWQPLVTFVDTLCRRVRHMQ